METNSKILMAVLRGMLGDGNIIITPAILERALKITESVMKAVNIIPAKGGD